MFHNRITSEFEHPVGDGTVRLISILLQELDLWHQDLWSEFYQNYQQVIGTGMPLIKATSSVL